MKKLAIALGAVCVAAVVAPTMASAEKIVIREGHRHWHGPRAEFRAGPGWHRGWHRGEHRRPDVVVIKRGHRHYRD